MRNESGIYTLELTLSNGERIIKLGWADNMAAKFHNSPNIPTTIYYTNKKKASKQMISDFNADFKVNNTPAGFFPSKYRIIMDIRIKMLEESMVKIIRKNIVI